MSSTGVRESNSNNRRIITGLIQNEAQFIQSLRVFANTSTLSGLGSTEGDSNNSPNQPSGNYFARSGDILLGQFGNSFEIVTITNGQLNIAKGIGFTSPMLVVNPEGGAPDFLDKLIPGTDVFTYQEQLLQTVSQDITIRPKLSLTITNIVGNGVDNIITVTVASTSALTTGDKVDISNTTNFNIGDAAITVTGGTTFTYDLGSIGSATPESSGDADRGNFKLPDDTEFVAAPNTIVHAIFNTVTQLWDFGTEISSGGGSGGEFFGPWTANHDAGNFALNNISSIQISDSVGGIHSLLQGLAGTGTRLTLTTGEKFQIFDNITSIVEIDNTTGLKMIGSHVINMNNNIINTISELQFSNGNAHTPSNELTIAFDLNDDALKYSVPLTTDSHRFYADTDLLASFSRVGSNEGLLSVQAVTAAFLQATENVLLSTFNNTTPTNGEVWRNTSGVFQFRQNGVTLGLGANQFLSNLSNPTALNQNINMLGNLITLDVDKDTSISSFSDDSIQILTGASTRMAIDNTGITISVNLSILGNVGINNNDLTAVNNMFITTSGGADVGSIRGINSSPDILEVRLGGAVDFAITDNGTPRLAFNNTLLKWEFGGSSLVQLPQETQISDRTLAPSTPSSGFMSLYVINSAGSQTFKVKFDNGVEKTIATDV